MATVDQFESIFNAASKPAHRYEPARYSRIAVITDLDAEAADGLARRLRAAFGTLAQSEWWSMPADRSETVEQLLDLVDLERLDLVVTYRNLHSAAWQWPHRLDLVVTYRNLHSAAWQWPHSRYTRARVR